MWKAHSCIFQQQPRELALLVLGPLLKSCFYEQLLFLLDRMIMLNKRGLCQWEIDLEFLRVDSKYL